MAVNSMDSLVSLAKRRGFIFPGSDLYGGLANSWDYGPLGVELKNNIKQLWWKRFVHGRDDIVGLDASIIMSSEVWKASGHLKHFHDPLVECKKCHHRFRADELKKKTCPDCEGTLTSQKQFNLMFKTFFGSSEDTASTVYLRPETAQAMFVDFSAILDSTRMKIPFGIAQIGKAFRNEITAGNFIFRTREFEMMEIEYFIKEKEWKKYFDYWLSQMKLWLQEIGINKSHLHFEDIPDGERAHYSKRTVDIEYDYPFGQKELYGIAYRTDYDLKRHQKFSGKDLTYRDPVTKEKFVPHVIEPTFGVERTVLAVLLGSYNEIRGGRTTTTDSTKEVEVVLRLPKTLAPIKIAVLPLVKKERLQKLAQKIIKTLSFHWHCQYDEVSSIGRRYRRQDEIGTPYCLTVDFETLEDNKVTIRDRDTMKQERIVIDDLKDYFQGFLSP